MQTNLAADSVFDAGRAHGAALQRCGEITSRYAYPDM